MEGSIQNKFNTLKEPARHLKVWIEPGSLEFLSKVENYENGNFKSESK